MGYSKNDLINDLKILFGLEELTIGDYYIISYNYSQENIGVEKYITEMDFKKFYGEFAEFLTYNPSVRFKDAIYFDEGKKIKGEFYESDIRVGEDPDCGKRTGNMFEKRYRWFKKNNGNSEFEIVWEFRAPIETDRNGWTFIWMEFVNRNCSIVEKIIDGNKKTLYGGKYEIRSKFIYNNKIIFERLLNLKFFNFFTPKEKIDEILKTGKGELSSFHNKIIFLYIKYIYIKYFLFELDVFEKGRAEFVMNFVRKHFNATKL